MEKGADFFPEDWATIFFANPGAQPVHSPCEFPPFCSWRDVPTNFVAARSSLGVSPPFQTHTISSSTMINATLK